MTFWEFMLAVVLPLAAIIGLSVLIAKKLPNTPYSGTGCSGG